MSQKSHELPDIETVQKKTWLTIIDFQVYTGLGRDVQRRLRTEGTQKGTLPFQQIGTNIRYNRKQVDDFLKRHTVKSDFL